MITPQKAIEILTKMISVLEQGNLTNCLCGAYMYAVFPIQIPTDKIIFVNKTADEKTLNEIGLFRPDEPYNDQFWFEIGDTDVRIKYCKQAIEKWKITIDIERALCQK
jgi:hypothetical protein